MTSLLANLLDIFSSPLWSNVVFVLKIITVIVASFSVAGTVMIIIKTLPFRQKIETAVPGAVPVSPKDKIAENDWARVIKEAETAQESNASLIVIEADTIVDNVLRRFGISGDNMGERMKALQGQLSSLDDLWYVHKIRNEIAHTPGYRVTPEELPDILAKYQRVLKELEAI